MKSFLGTAIQYIYMVIHCLMAIHVPVASTPKTRNKY